MVNNAFSDLIPKEAAPTEDNAFGDLIPQVPAVGGGSMGAAVGRQQPGARAKEMAAFGSTLKKTFAGTRVEQFSGKNRNIQGTNTPSMHNTGEALDIYGPNLEEYAKWASKQPGMVVIYNRKYWENGVPVKDYNRHPHTDHVHVQPRKSKGSAPKPAQAIAMTSSALAGTDSKNLKSSLDQAVYGAPPIQPKGSLTLKNMDVSKMTSSSLQYWAQQMEEPEIDIRRGPSIGAAPAGRKSVSVQELDARRLAKFLESATPVDLIEAARRANGNTMDDHRWLDARGLGSTGSQVRAQVFGELNSRIANAPAGLASNLPTNLKAIAHAALSDPSGSLAREFIAGTLTSVPQSFLTLGDEQAPPLESFMAGVDVVGTFGGVPILDEVIRGGGKATMTLLRGGKNLTDKAIVDALVKDGVDIAKARSAAPEVLRYVKSQEPGQLGNVGRKPITPIKRAPAFTPKADPNYDPGAPLDIVSLGKKTEPVAPKVGDVYENFYKDRTVTARVVEVGDGTVTFQSLDGKTTQTVKQSTFSKVFGEKPAPRPRFTPKSDPNYDPGTPLDIVGMGRKPNSSEIPNSPKVTTEPIPTQAKPPKAPAEYYGERQVIWEGKTYNLSDPHDQFAYDVLHKDANAEIRALEKKAVETLDLEEKRRLMLEANALRRGLAERKAEFFSDLTRRQAEQSGVVDNLDDLFTRAVADSDAAESVVVKRISNFHQRAYTTLPVGDLKQLAKDLHYLAVRAVSKGEDAAKWMSNTVRSFGKGIVEHAKRAWNAAKKWWDSPAEGTRRSRQAGGIMPRRRRVKIDAETLDAGREAYFNIGRNAPKPPKAWIAAVEGKLGRKIDDPEALWLAARTPRPDPKTKPNAFIEGPSTERFRESVGRKEGGAPVNPNVTFESADVDGKKLLWTFGDKTPAQWVKEQTANLSPAQIKQFKNWYEDLVKLFKAHGYTEREVVAWAANNVNQSTDSALGGTFKAMDQIAGYPFEGATGLGDENVRAILSGGKATFGPGAKIPDFADSSLTRGTRTFMGDDPSRGAPFVADLHTTTDRGHISDVILAKLADTKGIWARGKLNGVEIDSVKIVGTRTKKVKATKTNPKGTAVAITEVEVKLKDGTSVRLVDDTADGQPKNYEAVSDWGQEVSGHLNETGALGKSKWKPHQVQAVGWMNVLLRRGEPLQTPDWFFRRQTSVHSHELAWGDGSVLSGIYPSLSKLDPKQAAQITYDVISKASTDIAKIMGGSLRVVETRLSHGFWGGELNPNVQIVTTGSYEMRRMLSDALASVGEQSGVWHTTFERGKQSGAFLRHANGAPLTVEELDSFIKFAQKEKVKVFGASYLKIYENNAHFIGGLSDLEYNKLKQSFQRWANNNDIEVKITGVKHEQTIYEQDWTGDPSGSVYRRRLQDSGRAGLDRDVDHYRRAYAEAIEDAFEKHAPGVLDKAKRQERVAAASAARPTVEALATDRVKKLSQKSKDAGFTTLPVGDLKQLVKDLETLATAAIRSAKKFGQWAVELSRDFGRGIVSHARAAWSMAKAKAARLAKEFSGPTAAADRTFAQRGAVKPKPPQIGGHLATALDEPDIKPGIGYWLKRGFQTDAARASQARKALEKSKGQKLLGAMEDIEESINRQSRVGHKVEDMVMRGIVGEDGERASKGVKQIFDLFHKHKIDPELWQRFKRALRENELFAQGRGTAGAARVEQNSRFVDEYLEMLQQQGKREAFAEIEREWQKLVDSHLGLFERYGLRDEGWAQSIRDENSFYFPLFTASTAEEAAMRKLNPQTVASPGGKVFQARGSDQYIDGFAAMAREIEKVVRVGEATKGYLPYLDSASKQSDLAHWVKEIKADDIDEGMDFASAELEKVFGKTDFAEGQDAIIRIYDKGKLRTFQVDPFLWDALRKGMPQAQNPISVAMQLPGKVARAGTTGPLNPLFQLIFNPIIDFTSASITAGITPVGWVRAFLSTLGRTKSKLYRDAISDNVFFNSKGIRDFLEQEWLYDPEKRNVLQRGIDQVLENNGVRLIKTPVDLLQFLGQTMEETTRLAAYAKTRGAAVKKGATRDIAGRLGAKTAADIMNFGEVGEVGKFFSRAGVPYANIPYQVALAHAKAFQKNPVKYVTRAAAYVGAPAFVEWSLYHDDPEWANQPDYVRYGSVMFRDGILRGKPHEGNWVAIRIPEEVGVLVRGTMFDTLDKKLGKETFVKAAVEQAKNFVPSSPTWLSLLGQWMFYHDSGGVMDTRFWSLRAYPLDANAKQQTIDKNQYKYTRQQIDTAFGSMGRYIYRKVAYEQDKGKEEKERREVKDPSMFQRFRPEGGKGTVN